MNTIIFLIVMSYGSGTSAHNVSVTEMPNLQMCESVGKSIVGMSKYIKWNCIEGVR